MIPKNKNEYQLASANSSPREFALPVSKDGQWLAEKVESKRQRLILTNKMSLENLKKAVEEVRVAERRILSELIPEDETQVTVDSHVFEADLNEETRRSLGKILPELGILLAYENEDLGSDAVIRVIELLSPDSKENDKYVLKIHVRRTTNFTPFFIDKVEIVPR